MVTTGDLVRGDPARGARARAFKYCALQTLGTRNLEPVSVAGSAFVGVGVVIAELLSALFALHLRNDLTVCVVKRPAERSAAGPRALAQLGVLPHPREAHVLVENVLVGPCLDLLLARQCLALVVRAPDRTDAAVVDEAASILADAASAVAMGNVPALSENRPL